MKSVTDIPDEIRNIMELFYAGNRDLALLECKNRAQNPDSPLSDCTLVLQILSNPPDTIHEAYAKLIRSSKSREIDEDFLEDMNWGDFLPSALPEEQSQDEHDDDLSLNIVISAESGFGWPLPRFTSEPSLAHPVFTPSPDLHAPLHTPGSSLHPAPQPSPQNLHVDSALLTPPKPYTATKTPRAGTQTAYIAKAPLNIDSALLTPPKPFTPVIASNLSAENPNESNPQILARPVSYSTATLITRYQNLLVRGKTALSPIELEELQTLESELTTEATHYLSPLSRIPSISASFHEIKRIEGLDHHDGFVLSLIDGQTCMLDIVALSGMPEHSALFILFKLELMGLMQIND